jgi:hypothetical protein
MFFLLGEQHPATLEYYYSKAQAVPQPHPGVIEAFQRPGPIKEELLARARAKGLNL